MLFVQLIQLVNGAQFLNITPLFLLSVLCVLPLSIVPAIAIVPLGSCMHRYNCIKLTVSLKF